MDKEKEEYKKEIIQMINEIDDEKILNFIYIVISDIVKDE